MSATNESNTPDAVEVRGQWFARPNGEGSDVGPFSSEEEALTWVVGDQRPDEDDYEYAERIAKRLGWLT
jgi:hypothetical protein